MKFEINPIGFIQSCYKEKFATPRQPGLVNKATGQIKLIPPYNHPDAFAGLEECSHIWLQFIFHQCIEQGWKNKVRPPRLGGNKKMGVFATRATHRPNALGLSVVKLDKIEIDKKGVILNVSGLDLVDGTPIVDIKPYIPYSDALIDASYPFAQNAPKNLNVIFNDASTEYLAPLKDHQHLKDLIAQVLAQDPKPAFHKIDRSRIYAVHLESYNIQFCYGESNNEVFIEVIAIAEY